MACECGVVHQYDRAGDAVAEEDVAGCGRAELSQLVRLGETRRGGRDRFGAEEEQGEERSHILKGLRELEGCGEGVMLGWPH